MLLLEIAAQGVNGVALAGGNARLRPGYNLVPVEGAALRRLLAALFQPAPGDAEALCGQVPPRGAARAGATVLGDDGATWRLVRDLGGGAPQLYRLDPQRRAFALFAEEPAALAAALAERVGVPNASLAALLAVAAEELPSRRSILVAPALAPAARRPGAGGAERVAELRAELVRARRAEELQSRIDELHSRLAQGDDALRQETALREALAEAERALEACRPALAAEAALGDVEAKLAVHGRAVVRREEGLAKLAADRAALAEAEVRGAPRAPWKDLRFWAGAATGVAALAAGFASARGHPLRYAALLDLPAFGWSAWVALGWVEALEDEGRAGRRRKLAEEHEQKIEETFQREATEVRAALAAAGVASVPELKEALARLAAARAAAQAARARLEAFETSGDLRSAREQRARVEPELRDLERALGAEAGGFVRDPRSVEMELARVEAEAAAPPAPTPVPVPAALPTPAGEPIDALLRHASAALGDGAAAVPRATQVAYALSAGRIAGLSLDAGGRWVAQLGGRGVPERALPVRDRDLVFLAVKLALLEQALAGGRRAALLDDVFTQLPEAARRVLARFLKLAARPGQVLHATADAACREAADHLAQAQP